MSASETQEIWIDEDFLVDEVEADTVILAGDYLDERDGEAPLSIRAAMSDIRDLAFTLLSDEGLYALIADMCSARELPVRLDS